MDLDQLAALDRIVREGGFGRAAVALGVGQPAVSARIRALEEQVGGALFTRGRQVRLTALGERFLPYARRALEVLGEGVEAARLAQTGDRGQLRLGSLASLAGGLVGPALGAVLRGRPGLDCVVKAGDHERIVSLLLDGVVELGLVTWPCTEAAAADLQPLLAFREPVVLAVAPGHPLAALARPGADDVARLARPFYRLRWWQRHHPVLAELAERAGAAVEVPMETARTLTLAGVGGGFFVQTYVADDLGRRTLVPVPVRDLAPLHRDSALVRRRRAEALSPAAAAAVEAIRVEARRLGLLAAPAAPAPRRRRIRRTARRA